MTGNETIRKYFQGLVEQGKILQEPANYDAATLKIYIDYLEQEVEKLKARLEKTIELPCKVGDVVYGIGITNCDDELATDQKQKLKIFNDCMKMSGHCEKCKHGHLGVTEFVCTHIQIGENGIADSNIFVVGKRYENYTAENVFTTREAAEARLKELQGGRKK